MKVRICYTVEVDEHTRRKMRERYGDDRLATRKEIQRWYKEYGRSMDDDLNDMKDEEREGCDEKVD